MVNKLRKISFEIKKLCCILNRRQKLYGGIVLFLSIIAALLEVIGVSVIIPRRECIQTLNRKLRQKRAQK